MAVRGTSEIMFGTHQTTFWDHIGRLLGGGKGRRVVLMILSLKTITANQRKNYLRETIKHSSKENRV